ncbi:MAG TPA: hypothetical protein VFG83_05625 [Kofleriaceae bacterium]|nr:hypothetical protein [Kofleriaceae bacterium]
MDVAAFHFCGARRRVDGDRGATGTARRSDGTECGDSAHGQGGAD